MSKKLFNITVAITLITLISKFMGLLRDVIMASVYGTTIQSDAFIMAQSIINIISVILIASLNTAFIPVYSEYIVKKNYENQQKFINVVYSFSLFSFGILSILCFIFSDQIVYFFAPNFSNEAFTLTKKLLKIMLPVVFLYGVVTLNSARLQIHGNFWVSAFIGYPLNICMIVSMLFFTGNNGIQILAVSYFIGIFGQFLIQYPFVKKSKHKYKIDFDYKEEGLKKITILMMPILVGTCIQQINTLVDRILASSLPKGSVTALQFSNQLIFFITGLFSVIVASIFYTSMSIYYRDGKLEEFKKMLKNSINLLLLIVIPAMFGFIILAMPIVTLIFERGAFSKNASYVTSIALFYYAIGILGYSLRDMLCRTFYALRDTKTVMFNGIMAVILNIISSISLFPFMGIAGLALGTSISSIVATLMLILKLKNKIGDFEITQIIKTFFKVLFASILMGSSTYFIYNFIMKYNNSNTLSLLISIASSVLIYSILILLLKIEEVDYVKNIFLHKIKNNVS